MKQLRSLSDQPGSRCQLEVRRSLLAQDTQLLLTLEAFWPLETGRSVPVALCARAPFQFLGANPSWGSFVGIEGICLIRRDQPVVCLE